MSAPAARQPRRHGSPPDGNRDRDAVRARAEHSTARRASSTSERANSLFGDAAARRGIAHPERLVREFKRRIGDDVPIVAGRPAFPPNSCTRGWSHGSIDTVTERGGRPPAAISVAVPVTWTDVPHRSRALRARPRGLARRRAHHRAGGRRASLRVRHGRSEPAAILAVYDLGGGTFDAVVLRKDDQGDAERRRASRSGSLRSAVPISTTSCSAMPSRRRDWPSHSLAADPDARIALAVAATRMRRREGVAFVRLRGRRAGARRGGQRDGAAHPLGVRGDDRGRDRPDHRRARRALSNLPPWTWTRSRRFC